MTTPNNGTFFCAYQMRLGGMMQTGAFARTVSGGFGNASPFNPSLGSGMRFGARQIVNTPFGTGMRAMTQETLHTPFGSRIRQTTQETMNTPFGSAMRFGSQETFMPRMPRFGAGMNFGDASTLMPSFGNMPGTGDALGGRRPVFIPVPVPVAVQPTPSFTSTPNPWGMAADFNNGFGRGMEEGQDYPLFGRDTTMGELGGPNDELLPFDYTSGLSPVDHPIKDINAPGGYSI